MFRLRGKDRQGALIIVLGLLSMCGIVAAKIGCAVVMAGQHEAAASAAMTLGQITQPPLGAVPATLEAAHDADTITACIHLQFLVDLPHRRIRAQGYDAWEIDRTRQTVGPITDAEIAKGKAARQALLALLDGGELWLLEGNSTGKADPHSREEAFLYIKLKSSAWIDVAKWAKESGHVRTP